MTDNMYIMTDNPDYLCALGEAKKLGKKDKNGNDKVRKLLKD